MDKVIIYNSLESYGFLITTFFLNEGYEVIGVKGNNSAVTDENRLEVGRNSNFAEIAAEELTEFTRSCQQDFLFVFNLTHLKGNKANIDIMVNGLTNESTVIILLSLKELTCYEEVLTPFQHLRKESIKQTVFFLPEGVDEDEESSIVHSILDLSSVKLLT